MCYNIRMRAYIHTRARALAAYVNLKNVLTTFQITRQASSDLHARWLSLCMCVLRACSLAWGYVRVHVRVIMFMLLHVHILVLVIAHALRVQVRVRLYLC